MLNPVDPAIAKTVRCFQGWIGKRPSRADVAVGDRPDFLSRGAGKG